MKKLTLSIIGIVIQIVGTALMLLNINSDNKSYLWVGLTLVFIGLAFAIGGMYVAQKSKK